MPKLKNSQDGFTLVELLLVVFLIGVMATMLLSLINYTQHTKNANDAIMRVNVEKLVTGLEAYRTIEGHYPSDPNADGNPSDDPYLTNYLRDGWLNGEPAGAVYSYYVSGGKNNAAVMVTLNNGKKFKYMSDWSQPMECLPTVQVNDTDCL